MTYPGGKSGSGVYQTLINLMPPHTKYVEPFLGMGGIMRRKRPAEVSYGFDLDLAVIEAWENINVPGLFIQRGNAFDYLQAGVEYTKSTLVYCDPPYPLSTRASQGNLYNYELTDAQHEELLEILLDLRCMVMISSYENPIYTRKLRRWNRVDYTAVTRGGTVAKESVWFNYPKPVALHDYRFVGKNFREREKFKRRRDTWRRKFERMSPQEKMSMFAAIDELRADTARREHGTTAAPGRQPAAPLFSSIPDPDSGPKVQPVDHR